MSARHSAPSIFLRLWPSIMALASLVFAVVWSSSVRLCLLDRQRIDRRADRAGNRNCGRDEHELVHLVGAAISGKLGDLEDFAHGDAHDRDSDPVPRLVDALLGFVRTHFTAPGIARYRSDLVPVDPFE